MIGIVRVKDDDELMMMTARGKIQRVKVSDFNPIGRNTQGVRIMSLEEGDYAGGDCLRADGRAGRGSEARRDCARKHKIPDSNLE